MTSTTGRYIKLQSPNSRSSKTISQSPEGDNQRSEFYSLAGPPQTSNQGIAYLHPDYIRYNPQYSQKHQDSPVWSLAQPLPHVVRNGMRASPSSLEKDDHEQEQRDRPSVTAENQPAATEPPAAEPAGKEQEQGKLEAQRATHDNRDFFNLWGKWRGYVRQELAEWLGVTLAMTLGLCAGLSTYTSQSQAGSFPSLAAAWGFAFMTAIYVAGGISGGHLNPAISISLSVWRGFPARKCLTYALAQLIGAITASGIAYAIYHDSVVQAASMSNVPQNQSVAKQAMVTLPKEFVHPVSAFFTEFIGSAILMGVIMALGDDTNAPPGAGMQAFIIGIVISVLILALGFTTGGCFNPARDFGGRLVTVMAGWGGHMFREYHAWWVWGPWIADICGGLFGGFLYDLIIFTGGESPINYPPRRRKRALLLRERNIRKKVGLGREKVPDLERAAQDYE
ncbi:aquaporin-like protein [Aspergillus aurantiobrunneus]